MILFSADLVGSRAWHQLHQLSQEREQLCDVLRGQDHAALGHQGGPRDCPVQGTNTKLDFHMLRNLSVGKAHLCIIRRRFNTLVSRFNIIRALRALILCRLTFEAKFQGDMKYTNQETFKPLPRTRTCKSKVQKANWNILWQISGLLSSWDLLGGAHQGQMTGHENRITQVWPDSFFSVFFL